MARFCHVTGDVCSCSAPPTSYESHDLFGLSCDGFERVALLLLLLLLLLVALEVGVLTNGVICGEESRKING